MAAMTAPSASAAQLGTAPPAISRTNHSGWLCPHPPKGRRREKPAPRAEQTQWCICLKVGQRGHICKSHYLRLKFSLFWVRTVTQNKLIKWQIFNTNLSLRVKDIRLIYSSSREMATAPKRWGVKGTSDCAVLLSSSGRMPCQGVVNWWQQGRLFVWILFRLTSKACGLSLSVDVFLSGGSCIDKVPWPRTKQ